MIACVIAAGIFFINRNNKKKRWALGLLAAYIYLIFISTVFAREVKTGASFKPVLFWTYTTIKNGGWQAKQLIVQIIANVVMMIPIGALAPVVISKRKLLMTMLIGLSLSAGIEILQLVMQRGLCEFDDIFHNSIGVLIGFGIYKVFVLIMSKKLKR